MSVWGHLILGGRERGTKLYKGKGTWERRRHWWGGQAFQVVPRVLDQQRPQRRPNGASTTSKVLLFDLQ